MRIAIIHSRVREEERLLADEFERRGLSFELIDIRREIFDYARADRWSQFDIVLDRCVSLTTSLAAGRFLEAIGVTCINRPNTIELSSDKFRTSLALRNAGIPTPDFRLALDEVTALEAVEQLGYPAVIKPPIGSWGRLVARVNDRHAAEAIIEHRLTLGSVQQHLLYVQEFIDKPGRDIRVFVVGGEPIAAISRSSQHWVTNTARGATAEGLSVSSELAQLSRAAAQTVQGDIVAIDLLECPHRGLLVNEINHSMEFRNSIRTTGVDIPARIAELVLARAAEARPVTTAVVGGQG